MLRCSCQAPGWAGPGHRHWHRRHPGLSGVIRASALTCPPHVALDFLDYWAGTAGDEAAAACDGGGGPNMLSALGSPLLHPLSRDSRPYKPMEKMSAKL